MDKTYQLGKSGGGVTSVKIKDHTYDVVEFTVGKYVEGDNGKAIVDSAYTVFFSQREFRDFFNPIINDLKVRFENESTPNEG